MADNDKIVFSIKNQDAIDRLRRDGKIELPRKELNIPKDMRWNEKNMASMVLRGLENGDSVQKISRSILPEIMSKTDFSGKTQQEIYGKGGIIDKNIQSSIRNARTMVTSAENHGRLDSYENLSNQGVVMKKEWEATPDDRVRPSHRDIDGEQQDIDKPFSNGCMYPGDGKGPAEEVWMCRCAMGSHIVGFKRADGSISHVDYDRDKTLHDEQMENVKEDRTSFTVVNGKDISDTWVRRPDQFDFEIEDVINAQGFDGLPRVVDAEEFDRYVQESNFIAQRTYSAPNQETLDAYRDQLYNGKWYVDCSTGGAAYGQGMYCCYDYGKVISEKTKHEMIAYGANSEFAHTETFTLSKDAKTITMSELNKKQQEYSSDIINGLMERGGFANKEAIKWADERNHLVQEAGSFATSLGYDAVIVDNGIDNYAVILNRTKCIFKGE